MSDDENRDGGIRAQKKEHYGAIASQEEIYLEEVEENLRAIPISDQPSPMNTAESFNEQLDHVADEWITGDADDAPLAVAEALRMTLRARRSERCDG